jgi:hypothetical protein
MTKLLEEAVEEVKALPEDDQDRAAEALIAFARERSEYELTADAGIQHAVGQADRGEFASGASRSKIFGHAV